MDSSETKTLETTVQELGHANQGIDIFKCDCEGCEYQIGAAFGSKVAGIKQLQLELHMKAERHYRGQQEINFMNTLIESGFVIHAKEPNTESFGGRRMAIEFAFIKLDPEIFH